VKELAQLLNAMQQAGVVAQMRYTEAVALLESGSASRESIGSLAVQHGLAGARHRFESRFLNE
jgi:hypothetical protein